MKLIKPLIGTLLLFYLCVFGYTQNQATSKLYSVPLLFKSSPINAAPDYQPKMTNVEMPSPGSAKYHLEQVKRKSAKRFSRTSPGNKSWTPNEAYNPNIEVGFPLKTTYVFQTGDTIVDYHKGGIPNDNTMAISNDGLLVASYNSYIFGYNTNTDTNLFDLISLHNFSKEFTLNDKYDPKIIYDPIEDRFILFFLNGRKSTENQIIVAFSTTNNPADEWNLYAIPGNPLNDTTWFDYPAIALTENEVFLTGNQLKDNESWQLGFRQTVIWQIDKSTGYNGDSTLTTRLWSDINYNGEYIRNLNPIQGGSIPKGPNMYLLSNKNFSVLSDTIWFLEITGEQDDPNTELKITLGKTNVPYGAPPNGRQNHQDSLATNDARVLGGFIENNEIQFVANTIDTVSGYAAIYHGFISNLDSTPTITGKILAHDSLDLGYPNIVYMGSHGCSRQSIIAVNHTSPWHGAGYSAIQYRTDNTYSNLITLKKGEGHIDRLNGTERWGDYSGIQRKYNEPGFLWCSGFYARTNNQNYTWVSKLSAATEIDSTTITATTINDISLYGNNDGSISITATGGVTPYSYHWNDTSITTGSVQQLGPGDYSITVTDMNNCSSTTSATLIEPNPNSSIFPNPMINELSVFFELSKPEVVYVEIYDLKGAIIKALYGDKTKSGSNVFTFNTQPLDAGTYILKIRSDSEEILSKKIIKVTQ